MRARRDGNVLVLSLGEIEREVLAGLLTSIIRNYRVKPGDWDARARAAWYSTRGCESAGMSAEETRDWLDQLFGYKSSVAQRLETWRDQIRASDDVDYDWRIPVDDAPALITALNDHRLMAAARNDIGQTEMDMRFFDILSALKPEQQAALYEIEFLGLLMEVLLRLLDGPTASEAPAE